MHRIDRPEKHTRGLFHKSIKSKLAISEAHVGREACEMKMSRKILVGTTALLALFFMTISSVMATRPEKLPYSETVQFTITAPGEWTYLKSDILRIEGMTMSGPYDGTLGLGTMDVVFEHITLNTATGNGTCLATWLITIDGNTMWGSANGKIIGGLEGTSEGYFRGTHGTGEFAHIEKMGTYWADLSTGAQTAEGVIIYH